MVESLSRRGPTAHPSSVAAPADATGKLVETVYSALSMLVRGGVRLLDLHLDVRGTEYLGSGGAAIVAGNHISFADWILALPPWRRSRQIVRFLAQERWFHSPVIGSVLRVTGQVRVDPGAGVAAFDTALAALARGETLCVFPEAGISRSLELRPFKSGASRLAMAASVPLIPCALWGTQRLAPPGRRSGLRTCRHATISIRFGTPLLPAPGDRPADLTRRLRAAIEGLLGEAQTDYPDHPRSRAEAWWLPVRLGGTAMGPDEDARLRRPPPRS